MRTPEKETGVYWYISSTLLIMTTINKYKAERLMNRQRERCYYCLKKFSDKRSTDWKIRKVTVDHVKPRCEMKDLDYKEQNHCNTVLACLDCNRRKALWITI